MKSDATRYPNRPWRKWYSTARWRRIREAQLAHQPLCERCLLSETVTAADVVHHRTAHKGDPDLFWYGPFESLCASHHNSQGQMEDHGKVVVQFGPDGWPL